MNSIIDKINVESDYVKEAMYEFVFSAGSSVEKINEEFQLKSKKIDDVEINKYGKKKILTSFKNLLKMKNENRLNCKRKHAVC